MGAPRPLYVVLCALIERQSVFITSAGDICTVDWHATCAVRVEKDAAIRSKADAARKAAEPKPAPKPKAADPPKPGPRFKAHAPPYQAPPAPEDTFKNHYVILGVAEFTATSIEVKKAFHKLALKYHPDKVGTRQA